MRLLSHGEAGGIEWTDHKGAKISAYIAYSRLTPQRGFHSYTSSQRDPVNLASLSAILISLTVQYCLPHLLCLLFLSCEITVK